LEAKVARFESDLTCHPREQLLYQAVAEALGYSQNRRPFRRLAELVPLELAIAFIRHGDAEKRGCGETDDETGRECDREIARHVAAESLLLGAAGLLPSQRGMQAGDDYARLLEQRWAEGGRDWAGGSMSPTEWEFFRTRPANFPPRRVAALAKVVRRWPDEGLLETLAAMVLTLRPTLVPRAMESLLLDNNHEGYWNSRCDFGLSIKRPSGLIGRQKAAELVVNVFLPFLVGWASYIGDGGLATRAREVYQLYPKRGDNEITRYMAVQIAGITRPKVARSACRQQGLLRLYRAYCEAKSCAACPVAAYPLPYYR